MCLLTRLAGSQRELIIIRLLQQEPNESLEALAKLHQFCCLSFPYMTCRLSGETHSSPCLIRCADGSASKSLLHILGTKISVCTLAAYARASVLSAVKGTSYVSLSMYSDIEHARIGRQRLPRGQGHHCVMRLSQFLMTFCQLSTANGCPWGELSVSGINIISSNKTKPLQRSIPSSNCHCTVGPAKTGRDSSRRQELEHSMPSP